MRGGLDVRPDLGDAPLGGLERDSAELRRQAQRGRAPAASCCIASKIRSQLRPSGGGIFHTKRAEPISWRERFIEGLDQLVRMPGKRNAFHLEIFQRLIDSGYPSGFSECDRDDRAEIDFHPDLELIRTNIERFSDEIKSWG